jgi:predicted MFS family arabinose efflux permease
MLRFLQGIGQVVGPILGNFLATRYSFQDMMQIMSLMWAVYGICYFIFGGGIEAIKMSGKEKIAAR